MSAQVKKNKMKKSWDDRIFDIVTNAFLVFFVIIVAYPIYFVLIASFTDPVYVNNGDFLLWPKEWNFGGYKQVFGDPKIWVRYANTIIYSVGGVLIGVSIIMLSGYALSRKDLPGRGFIMKMMVATMYLSGGLIPVFLVVSGLGLVDTRFIIIVMGSFSVYNIIVARSFLDTNIPYELYEAAIMDGCGHPTFFVKVVLPLSKAIIAVMALYIAVGKWNNYFSSMIYLTDSNKYPLALYLREQLLLASTLGYSDEIMQSDPELALQLQKNAQVIKYALIVASTGPILCVYPFVQKYFMKGVMVGSIKG